MRVRRGSHSSERCFSGPPCRASVTSAVDFYARAATKVSYPLAVSRGDSAQPHTTTRGTTTRQGRAFLFLQLLRLHAAVVCAAGSGEHRGAAVLCVRDAQVVCIPAARHQCGHGASDRAHPCAPHCAPHAHGQPAPPRRQTAAAAASRSQRGARGPARGARAAGQPASCLGCGGRRGWPPPRHVAAAPAACRPPRRQRHPRRP